MADRALGNKEGWDETFQFKTTDQGIATHVFAAFHPSLAGKRFLGVTHSLVELFVFLIMM